MPSKYAIDKFISVWMDSCKDKYIHTFEEEEEKKTTDEEMKAMYICVYVCDGMGESEKFSRFFFLLEFRK